MVTIEPVYCTNQENVRRLREAHSNSPVERVIDIDNGPITYEVAVALRDLCGPPDNYDDTIVYSKSYHDEHSWIITLDFSYPADDRAYRMLCQALGSRWISIIDLHELRSDDVEKTGLMLKAVFHPRTRELPGTGTIQFQTCYLGPEIMEHMKAFARSEQVVKTYGMRPTSIFHYHVTEEEVKMRQNLDNYEYDDDIEVVRKGWLGFFSRMYHGTGSRSLQLRYLVLENDVDDGNPSYISMGDMLDIVNDENGSFAVGSIKIGHEFFSIPDDRRIAIPSLDNKVDIIIQQPIDFDLDGFRLIEFLESDHCVLDRIDIDSGLVDCDYVEILLIFFMERKTITSLALHRTCFDEYTFDMLSNIIRSNFVNEIILSNATIFDFESFSASMARVLQTAKATSLERLIIFNPTGGSEDDDDDMDGFGEFHFHTMGPFGPMPPFFQNPMGDDRAHDDGEMRDILSIFESVIRSQGLPMGFPMDAAPEELQQQNNNFPYPDLFPGLGNNRYEDEEDDEEEYDDDLPHLVRPPHMGDDDDHDDDDSDDDMPDLLIVDDENGEEDEDDEDYSDMPPLETAPTSDKDEDSDDDMPDLLVFDDEDSDEAGNGDEDDENITRPVTGENNAPIVGNDDDDDDEDMPPLLIGDDIHQESDSENDMPDLLIGDGSNSNGDSSDDEFDDDDIPDLLDDGDDYDDDDDDDESDSEQEEAEGATNANRGVPDPPGDHPARNNAPPVGRDDDGMRHRAAAARQGNNENNNENHGLRAANANADGGNRNDHVWMEPPPALFGGMNEFSRMMQVAARRFDRTMEKRLMPYTVRNWAGRRLLDKDTLSIGVWPHVLGRIRSETIASKYDVDPEQEAMTMCTDSIYHLMRESIFFL